MTNDVTKPTIGMALYGDLTHDSRVRREAATLATAGYHVVLYCLSFDGARTDLSANVTVVPHQPRRSSVLPITQAHRQDASKQGPLGPFRRAWRRVRWLTGYVGNLRAWGSWVVGHGGAVDIWHAHDLTALAAIASAVDSRRPLVYDAHEIFVEAGTARTLPAPLRRLLGRYERHLLRRVAALVTVNEDLKAYFEDRYAIDRLVVVHNCPAA